MNKRRIQESMRFMRDMFHKELDKDIQLLEKEEKERLNLSKQDNELLKECKVTINLDNKHLFPQWKRFNIETRRNLTIEEFKNLLL